MTFSFVTTVLEYGPSFISQLSQVPRHLEIRPISHS